MDGYTLDTALDVDWVSVDGPFWSGCWITSISSQNAIFLTIRRPDSRLFASVLPTHSGVLLPDIDHNSRCCSVGREVMRSAKVRPTVGRSCF